MSRHLAQPAAVAAGAAAAAAAEPAADAVDVDQQLALAPPDDDRYDDRYDDRVVPFSSCLCERREERRLIYIKCVYLHVHIHIHLYEIDA